MPRGRPREFDTDKALDRAMLLFWKHGYEGTSLAALADGMGVNMPSLYAAFGNKESLFEKVLQRYLERPASYLPRALEHPDAKTAIRNMLNGAIEMVMDPRHPDGCLLVQGALASGPEVVAIRKKLATKRAGAELAVRRRLERAAEEREIVRNADCAGLARYFITVIWGMSVQAAGGASREQLKEVAETAMLAWPGSDAADRTRKSKG